MALLVTKKRGVYDRPENGVPMERLLPILGAYGGPRRVAMCMRGVRSHLAGIPSERRATRVSRLLCAGVFLRMRMIGGAKKNSAEYVCWMVCPGQRSAQDATDACEAVGGSQRCLRTGLDRGSWCGTDLVGLVRKAKARSSLV